MDILWIILIIIISLGFGVIIGGTVVILGIKKGNYNKYFKKGK